MHSEADVFFVQRCVSLGSSKLAKLHVFIYTVNLKGLLNVELTGRHFNSQQVVN